MVKKNILSEKVRLGLNPPPLAVSGTLAILFKGFFYIIDIYMFLKPAISDMENGIQ